MPADERRDRVRRARHDVRAAATRSRRAASCMVPGRPGRVPVAHRRREPAARGLARPQGPAAAVADAIEQRARAVPGAARPPRTSRPATSAAASSRCSTLGMAFLSRPRLLMIDELSLGLAPSIVEQLLRGRAAAQGAGHDGHPRRAVGERRAHRRRDRVLHGEGRDPLPRPDERAARAPRRAALGVPRRRGVGRARRRQARDRARAATPAVARRSRRPRRRAGNGAHRRPARSSVDGVSKRFGGIAALTDVSFDVAEGEIVGFIGPNGAGKTTLFDVLSRLSVRRSRATCSSTASRIAEPRPRRAGAARARPLVPGRPAVPGAHRDGDDRRRARAQHRRARSGRGRAAPARRSPTPRRRCARTRRRADRAARPRRLPRQVRPRALDRQPARRRPRVRARARTRRCCCSTSRRPASPSARPRRSGRCCCASARMTGASLLIIEHDVPLLLVDRRPHDRARSRRGRRDRHTATKSSAIPASSRRIWESPKQSSLAAVPAASNALTFRGEAMATAGQATVPRTAVAANGRRRAAAEPSCSSATARSCSSIVVIVGVIAVVSIVNGGDDDDSGVSATDTTSTSASAPAADLPGGQGQGHEGDIEWGDGCDTETGRVKIPMHNAPPCVEPWDASARTTAARRRQGVTDGRDPRRAVQGSARPAAAGDRRRRGRRHRPERRQPGVDRLPEHVRGRRPRRTAASSTIRDDRSQRRTGRRHRGAGRRAEGHRHEARSPRSVDPGRRRRGSRRSSPPRSSACAATAQPQRRAIEKSRRTCGRPGRRPSRPTRTSSSSSASSSSARRRVRGRRPTCRPRRACSAGCRPRPRPISTRPATTPSTRSSPTSTSGEVVGPFDVPLRPEQRGRTSRRTVDRAHEGSGRHDGHRSAPTR